jgi:phosphonate degradation associated HDIG domain protein
MQFTLNTLCHLYESEGHQLYSGESISQLEHALQCAALAEAAQQPPTLIVACLLHDLGHLLFKLDDATTFQAVNDHHEERAIPSLRKLFPIAVTEPIRLHVQAKRYLCGVDPGYWAGLSAASQHSLILQGDRFSPPEAQAFITQPYAAEAVQLRRWDDQAKVVGKPTPDLAHFRAVMATCAIGGV